MKSMSFLGACMDYFGKLPGQTNVQFAAEVKALSDSDREEIKQGLQQNGYQIS